MKLDEIKSQLVTRQANLEGMIRNKTATVLMIEESLRDARADLAATQGAKDELTAILALLETNKS